MVMVRLHRPTFHQVIWRRESAVLGTLTRRMMTGLKQCEPSNDEQDRITIYGPKANATYLFTWVVREMVHPRTEMNG